MMKISGYQNRNVSFFRTKMFQNPEQTKVSDQKSNKRPEDRDTVMLSLFGQKNSRIRNLMEQKQFLLERKNELAHATLENGKDTKSVQDILDSYDEQLKNLEQQISQEMIRQNKEPAESSQTSEKDDRPKTKQEIEQERISSLVDLASGMSKARTVQSSQIRAEGEARVLESEIKMDQERGADPEITAKKEEKLAQLQQKAAELTAKTAEISGEVTEKIKEERIHGNRELPKEEERTADGAFESADPALQETERRTLRSV